MTGMILLTEGGRLRAGLPAVPERPVYWAQVERSESMTPALGQLRGATGRELRLLAESLAAAGRRDVALLGSPGDEDAAGSVAAIRYGSCIVLSSDALGDIAPEEADDLGVGSATAAARLLIQRATPGTAPLAAAWGEAAGLTMTSCAWSGPMACYQGSAPDVALWDQSRAYLRAWDVPLPVPGAAWERIPSGQAPATDGSVAGWILADLEQPGLYPSVPAHSGGSYWIYPVTRAVCPVSIMALPGLLASGAIVHGYLGGYACPAQVVDFEAVWRSTLPRKAAYQRAHAAMDPGDRWTARPGWGRWSWTQDIRPPWQRRPWAGLIRWAPAAETAGALLRAGACGAEVLGAHIDSLTLSAAHGPAVCGAGRREAAIGACAGVAAALDAHVGRVVLDPPERWTLRIRGTGRYYGIGSYEIRDADGGRKVGDMAGAAGRGRTAELTDAMRRDREWSSDPGTDPTAVSIPLSTPRHPWYEYTIGPDTVSGRHGGRG